MRSAVLSLLAVGLLAACEGEQAEPAPDDSASALPMPEPTVAADATATEAEETCGAEKLGRWLNSLPSDSVKAEIAEAAGHERIRYITPGDAVTLDYRPDRLNIETGTDGRIKLFRCG